ncbi:MAG: ABC transporter, ATP-binding protein (cluster 13, osmolytes), partial [uncultured Rubrobacteraceae bacterium]
ARNERQRQGLRRQEGGHDPLGGPLQDLPGAERARGREALDGDLRGRDRRLRRAVGLRQDHDDEDDQPDHRAELRQDLYRGRGRDAGRRGQAEAPHRLRHPADRPLPAHDHRRQHRDRPPDARLGEEADLRQDRRAHGHRRDRAFVPRALPEGALGRSAPEDRGGAGACGRPADHAHGRAVRRRRPDKPREAPGRVPQAPAGDKKDHRLRHARHRRGHKDGRPDRHPARPQRHRPVRHARAHPDRPCRLLRRELHWLRCLPQAPEPQPGAGHRNYGLARGGSRRQPRGGAGEAAPQREGLRPPPRRAAEAQALGERRRRRAGQRPARERRVAGGRHRRGERQLVRHAGHHDHLLQRLGDRGGWPWPVPGRSGLRAGPGRDRDDAAPQRRPAGAERGV